MVAHSRYDAGDEDELDGVGDDQGAFEGDEYDEATSACPHCGEEIYDDTDWCPYCNQFLTREDFARRRWPLWMIAGFAACLAVILMWVLFA